jgi:anti-sigma factor RsiW
MDHEELKGLLSDLLDGELEAGQRSRVEEHLASCAECRALLEDWKAMGRAFFSPRRPTPAQTEAFVSRVMARIPAAEPAAAEPTFRLDWRWLFPAFALSFAALGLAFVPSQPVQDPSTTLLLAAGGSDRVSRWIAQPEAKGIEDLLEVEEQ